MEPSTDGNDNLQDLLNENLDSNGGEQPVEGKGEEGGEGAPTVETGLPVGTRRRKRRRSGKGSGGGPAKKVHKTHYTLELKAYAIKFMDKERISSRTFTNQLRREPQKHPLFKGAKVPCHQSVCEWLKEPHRTEILAAVSSRGLFSCTHFLLMSVLTSPG